MRRSQGMWPSAFGVSILAHAAVIAVICGIVVLMPPQTEKGPIEVDLVTDVGGGGGGGGSSGVKEEGMPPVKEASATPTAPPPSPKAASDAEAENELHDMAPPAETAAPSSSAASDTSSTDSSSGSGSGTGSGGGNGSGTGTGDGSGTGEGSGSGSGGGTGDGTGSGAGSGDSSSGTSGGETMGPQVLSAPAPSYPESARRAGASGTVVVGLTISSDGSVSSAWVASSSGNSDLDTAAVNAVYSWQFVPAKQNGQPITVNSQVPVTFNLN